MGGPREPWHDSHCKVEGEIAKDLGLTFGQRWRRAVEGKKERFLQKMDLKPLFTLIKQGGSGEVQGDQAWSVQVENDGEN